MRLERNPLKGALWQGAVLVAAALCVSSAEGCSNDGPTVTIPTTIADSTLRGDENNLNEHGELYHIGHLPYESWKGTSKLIE